MKKTHLRIFLVGWMLLHAISSNSLSTHPFPPSSNDDLINSIIRLYERHYMEKKGHVHFDCMIQNIENCLQYKIDKDFEKCIGIHIYYCI